MKSFNHNLLLLSGSIPQNAYKGYCYFGLSSTDYILVDLKAPLEI